MFNAECNGKAPLQMRCRAQAHVRLPDPLAWRSPRVFSLLEWARRADRSEFDMATSLFSLDSGTIQSMVDWRLRLALTGGAFGIVSFDKSIETDSSLLADDSTTMMPSLSSPSASTAAEPTSRRES